MSDPIRSFVIEGEKISVPAVQGDKLLEKFPDAKEFVSFQLDKDTVDIPKGQADMFMMKFKDASPLPGYDFKSSTVESSATAPMDSVPQNMVSQDAQIQPDTTQVQPAQEIANPTVNQAPKYEIDGKEFANKDEFLKEVETYKGKPVTHNIKISNDQETDNRVKAITLNDDFYNKKIDEGDPSFAVSTYALEKHGRENYNKVSDQVKSVDEKIVGEYKAKFEADQKNISLTATKEEENLNIKEKDLTEKAKQINIDANKAIKALDSKDPKSESEAKKIEADANKKISDLSKEHESAISDYKTKLAELNSKGQELATKYDTEANSAITKERGKIASTLDQSDYFDKEDEASIQKALLNAPVDYAGKKAYIQELVDTYSAGFDAEHLPQVKKDLYAMIAPKVLFDEKGEPTVYTFKNQADTQMQRLIQKKDELGKQVESMLVKEGSDLYRPGVSAADYSNDLWRTKQSDPMQFSKPLAEAIDKLDKTRIAIGEYEKVLSSPEGTRNIKAGGFWENFTKETAINVATSGFYGAAIANRIAELANKGDKISAEDKEILNAAMLKNAVEGRMQDNYSMAQIVGKGLTDSLPFMTSMALSGGIAGVVGQATKKALKWQLMKTSLKSVAGVSNFAKGAASVMASSAVRVPLSGMYYEGLEKRRVDIQSKFEGNKFGTEATKSEHSLLFDLGRQFISNYPDFLSEGMEPAIGKYITTPIAKKLGLNWLTDAGKGKVNAAISKVANATNIHSFGQEILSEEVGNLMNVATGDQSAEDFFSLKSQTALVLTIAAMTTPMTVAKAVSGKPVSEDIETALSSTQKTELDKIVSLQNINDKAEKLTAFSFKHKLSDDQVMEVSKYAWDKEVEQVQQIGQQTPPTAETPTEVILPNITPTDNTLAPPPADQMPSGEMTPVRKTEEIVAEHLKTNTEVDADIAEAQTRLGLSPTPSITISDDTEVTLDKLDNDEPVTNEFIKKASDELYGQYKTLEAMKTADNRQYTTEQIESMQEFLGEEITKLEDHANKQTEKGDFVSKDEVSVTPEGGKGTDIAEAPTEKVAEKSSETAIIPASEPIVPIVAEEVKKPSSELTEKPTEVVKGSTATETINRDYAKLKTEIGEKKAQAYFKQADRLLSPNENEIVEYRKNGIVTKEGDKYIFHALADMDMKQWRVAFTSDVTDQVSKGKTDQVAVQDTEQPLAKGEVEATDKELNAISPKGVKDVYTAGRKIFGLNKVQALAQAIIVDRIVARMAKNKGISKLKAYEGIEFRKVDKAMADQVTEKQVQGNKGAMMMVDGKAVVMAMTDPNISTPLHEIAHVYERYMTEAERKSVLAWTGDKTWTVQTSEKFARGFERYLAEGISPNKALEAVFKRLKEWMADIYNGIKGSAIDITLSPNMQNLYDSILTGKKYVPLEEKSEGINEGIKKPKTTTEELDDLFGSLSFQSSPLFQAIGEKGAIGIEGLTDDLSVAKQMTEEGKDAKTIFLATGWEKFPDGWKYDLPDGKLIGQAAEDTQVGQSSNFSGKLGDIMEAPAFKAYPQLKDVNVVFSPKENNQSGGSWKRETNTITVNSAGADKQSILIHEVQHAIQSIEGFAKGGNLESGLEAVKKQVESKVVGTEEYKTLEKEVASQKGFFKGWTASSDAKIAQARFQMKQLFLAEAKRLLDAKTINEAKYEAYTRIAGEVEARNVQARLALSPERRKELMLSETEDVAEEQKIYIQKAIKGEALSMSQEDIPKTIEIDGVTRPTFNNKGMPIANTVEGIKSFWKWFGNSKTVGLKSEPLIANHYSESPSIDSFKIKGDDGYIRKHSVTNTGIYFNIGESLVKYGKYPYYVYLKFENPFRIKHFRSEIVNPYTNKQIYLEQISEDDIRYLKEQGYDSVWGSTNQVVAFSPNQIKSATDNAGSFSLTDTNILFQSNEDQITKALNQAIDIAEARVEKDVPKVVKDAIKRSGKPISEELVDKVLSDRGYGKAKKVMPTNTVDQDLKGMVDTAMKPRFKAAVEQGIKTQNEYDTFIERGFGSYTPTSQADAYELADVMFDSLGNTPDDRINNAMDLVRKEKMNADVAIALLVRASAEVETQQAKAKNEATIEHYIQKSVDILGVAESEGTNMGKGISFFNSQMVKKHWGWRTYMRDYEKSIKDNVNTFFGKNIEGKVVEGKFIPELDKNGNWILKGDLKKLSDALDIKKMVKEARPVVTTSPKYVEVRDKVTKPEPKEKAEKVKVKSLFSEWKSLVDTKKSGILFQGEERTEKQILSEIIGAYIRMGVYKTKDIIDKVKAEVKANIGRNISDEAIVGAIPTEVGGKPFEEWQEEEEEKKAAEVLAQRLKALASEKKPDNDPLHIMIRTLVSKASEKMSQGEKKGKTDLEIIAIAIKNRDAWMDVWNEAKGLAFEKIDKSKAEDDVKLSMKAKIEEAYRLATKAPFSEALLDRTIKETAEELGIRIDRIVHSSISERTLIKGELQKALIDKAGLSGSDAKALEDAVAEALDNFITVKSAKEVDKYITKQDKLKPVPLGKIVQLLKEETAKFKRRFPNDKNPFDYMRTEIRRMAKEKLQSDPTTQALYTDAKIDKMTDLNLAAAAFIAPTEVQDLANKLSADMRAKIANEEFLKDFPSEEKAKIVFMATSLQSESLSRTSQDEDVIIRSRAVSEMIGMVRAGAFENENFLRAFAIGKGIAPPTPSQVAEVKRLHDVMKKEKSEIIKKERELELTAYIANFTKPDIASIIQVSVVTGMLAGIGTQVYNATIGFIATQSMRAIQTASSLAHLDLNRVALVNSAWSKALRPNMRRAAGVLQSGYAHETSVLDVPTMIERARTDSKILNFMIAHAKYIIRAMTAPDGMNVGILEEGLLQLRMYDEAHKDWRSTGARSKKEWIKNFLYADLGITPQVKEQLRLELEQFINDAATEGRFYTKRQQLLLEREMIDKHRASVNINVKKWQHQAHRNATWFTGNAEFMGTIGYAANTASDFLKKAVNGFAPGVRVALMPVTAITLFLRIMSVVAEVSLNANPFIGYARLKRGGYGIVLNQKNNKNFYAIDEYDRDLIKKQMKFGAGVFAATTAILLSGVGGDDDDPWFTVTGGGGGLLFPDPIAAAQRGKTSEYQAFSLKFGNVHIPYIAIPGVSAALIPLGNLMDVWRFGTTSVTETVNGKSETHEILNRIRYREEKVDWFTKRLPFAWVSVPIFVSTQSTLPVAQSFSDLLVGSSVKAMTKAESLDVTMNDVMIAAMKYSNIKNAIAPAYIRDIYGSWAFLTNQAMDDGDNLEKVLVQNTLLQWAFMDKDTPQINVWGRELIVHDTPLNKRLFSFKESDPIIAYHNTWDKAPSFASMRTEFYIPGEDKYISRPLDMSKHDEWKAFYEFTKERGNLIYDAASRNMNKVDQEYRDAMAKAIEEATKQAKKTIQRRIDEDPTLEIKPKE